MLVHNVGDLIYYIINAGVKVKLFKTDGKGKSEDDDELIATFNINQDLTYFRIVKGSVFINQFECDPVNETITFINLSARPAPLYTINNLFVTYRSNLAVLNDYTFDGPSFTNIKTENISLNILYKQYCMTISECEDTTNGFLGSRNEFIQTRRLNGQLANLEHINCCRNHVHRGYGSRSYH